MEARVTHSDRDGEKQKSVFTIDQDETFDDLTQRVAAELGLFEDNFRLLLLPERNLLDSRQLLRELEFQNLAPVSSDSDPGEEQVSVVSEKSQQDSIEAEKNEKSTIKQKTKLLMSVFNKYMRESEEKKDGNAEGDESEPKQVSLYDKMFKSLRNEVYTVMRMSREDSRLQIPDNGVPYLQVAEFEVEEGYPVYFITANHELKSIACLGTDTMNSVRNRAAALYNCPVEKFQMRKMNEAGVLMAQADDDMTLDEIGMGAVATLRQFYVYSTGLRKICVMFGFCICQEIEANMDKPVRCLRKRITRVAPDLKYVNFYMCYNDISLAENEKTTLPLGKILMGGDCPVRVIIEIDFDLPYELDPGPELTIATADDNKNLSREERLRRFKERRNGGGFKPEAAEPVEKRRTPTSSEGSNGNEAQVRFNVNKRALTHFTILIDCHKFDEVDGSDQNKIDPDYDNKAPYEPPITLKRLTAKTRFYEIRDKIAKITNESCFHQILYKNGELFDSKDDCKTLKELDMIPSGDSKFIYKEPSITVNIKYKDITVPVTIAGRGTSFYLLADLINFEHHDKIPLRINQMLFELKGVMVPQNLLFSDCRVCHKDVINIIPAFRIRVWRECYAYDNDMVWPHTHPKELRGFVAEKTKISIEDQILVLIKDDGDSILEINNQLTMADLNINSNCEIDVFTRDDLPSRLQADGGFYVDSKVSSDEDSNHEEPDGAKAQAEYVECVVEDDEDDDDYDANVDK